MSTLILQPTTVMDAWHLYCEHLKATDPTVIQLAQTALCRYALPGFGLPTGAKKSEAMELMRKIPLHKFVDVLNVQQEVFDFLNTKKYIQRSNRHRLKQMLEWCSSQYWWELATGAQANQYAPRRRNNLGNAHHARLRSKSASSRYSLKNLEPSKMPGLSTEESKHFQKELGRIKIEVDQVYKFLTSTQLRYRQDKPIRKSTAEKTCAQIYLILGWLYSYEKRPLDELGLRSFDDVDIAYDFTEWLREERQVSPKTEIQALIAILNVNKFLYYRKSDQRKCESLGKSYIDIEIICEIRKLIRDTSARARRAPISISNEAQKWLDWPEYLACVEYLKKDCAPFTSDGTPRTERAIARSYERYLVAALLAYMPPDRQRTFRELEEGKTLVRGVIRNDIFYPKEDGRFYIKLGPEDYKTGDAYGEQILEVPESLYPELNLWLNKWRATLQPTHSFVFTQLNGKPYTGESLYQLFRHAIYRASVVLFGEGKATNPHLVRDMLVTYCYTIGVSDSDLDGLAVGMKHSRETQRRVYDRRTKQERVQPALKLMQQFKPVQVPIPKLRTVEFEPVKELS